MSPRAILHRLPTAASTNDELRRLAAAGAPDGTAVTAAQQTAGRGRLGRTWHSPPGGNVYLSYLHRSRLPAHTLAGLTLDAACAVAAVVAGEGVTPELKWPNDILVGGDKLGGILCELHEELGAPGPAVVVGVGLNVNVAAFPAELADIATSLRQLTGRDHDVDALAEALAQALATKLAGYEAQAGPDLAAYGRWFALAGRDVALVGAGGGSERARVVGVAADGGLEVLVAGQARTVRSGEVRIMAQEGT